MTLRTINTTGRFQFSIFVDLMQSAKNQQIVVLPLRFWIVRLRDRKQQIPFVHDTRFSDVLQSDWDSRFSHLLHPQKEGYHSLDACAINCLKETGCHIRDDRTMALLRCLLGNFTQSLYFFITLFSHPI